MCVSSPSFWDFTVSDLSHKPREGSQGHETHKGAHASTTHKTLKLKYDGYVTYMCSLQDFRHTHTHTEPQPPQATQHH